MSGHTKEDRVRNKCIKEKVEIASFVEKIVKSRLGWFGQMWRRPIETLVKKVDQMVGSPIVRG